MEEVKKRLHAAVSSLESAGVNYAVCGGNAVASWVASADRSAVRATRDVDLLIPRVELEAVSRVLGGLGLVREDLRGLIVFVDPHTRNRRTGIHLVFAGEKVRPSHPTPAPGIDEVVRSADGYRVVSLPALVRMKLNSYRDKDRVHLRDMLSVGLVTEEIVRALPEELKSRLDRLGEEDSETDLH